MVRPAPNLPRPAVHRPPPPPAPRRMCVACGELPVDGWHSNLVCRMLGKGKEESKGNVMAANTTAIHGKVQRSAFLVKYEAALVSRGFTKLQAMEALVTLLETQVEMGVYQSN